MRKIQVAILSPQTGSDEDVIFPSNEQVEFNRFSDAEHLFQILEDQEFDIILIDDSVYGNVAENLQFKHVMKTENVILFTKNPRAEHKQDFLEKGGWMIAEGEFAEQKLDLYFQQAEYLETSLKPSIYSKNILVTSLSQNSLHDILFNAFLERKSVEVFVLGEIKNGRIVVQEGEIILAEYGQSDDFEALIRMMMLRKGIVRVIPFYGQISSYKILPTLIGIHLESEFQKKMMNEWVKNAFQSDYESLNLVWKTNDKYVFKSHNEKKLASYLSQPRHLHQIVELIDEMPIKLLELLMNLVEQGILAPAEEAETKISAEEAIPPSSREDLIREKLDLSPEARSARLLILGLPASGKNEFISMLKGKGAEIKQVHNVEFSKIPISDNLELQLFGMEIDDSVIKFLDVLADKMNGYIFMIDATKVDRFEYTNYLINLFLGRYDTPALVVLSNTSHLAEDAIKVIMKKFQFIKPVKFINMEISELADPWKVINLMEKFESKLKDEGEQEND